MNRTQTPGGAGVGRASANRGPPQGALALLVPSAPDPTHWTARVAGFGYPLPTTPRYTRVDMEGWFFVTTRASAVVSLCLLAAGCIHSDTARSGYVDGRHWSERVADEPSRPYVDALRSELLALAPDVSEDEAAVLA